MTSDGISSDDWDQVHALAIEVVNSEDEDDRGPVERLRAFLQGLTAKYGELPSILATEADYVVDRRESEQLLLRAFDLAISINDAPNIREISLSLADMYASDFKQASDASRWLEIARAYIRPDSAADTAEYQRIQASLAELGS